MKRHLNLVASILLLFLTVAPVSKAAVIEGIAFDDTYPIQDTELQLQGYGLLRYMLFIKAYVGAFYMLPGTDATQALSATPRRLELSYFHAITAEDFAEATRQKMADNVSPETMDALAERLARFNSLYRDVQPGDRYALTYLPERGTELALNGRPLGRIEGDDFAAAVFAIWLGANPIDTDFRDALLGVP